MKLKESCLWKGREENAGRKTQRGWIQVKYGLYLGEIQHYVELINITK